MKQMKTKIQKRVLFFLLALITMLSIVNIVNINAENKNKTTKKVYNISKQVDLGNYRKIRSGKELLSRENPLSTKGLSNQEIQNLGKSLWSENKRIDSSLKVTLKNDAGKQIEIKFDETPAKNARATNVSRDLIRHNYQVVNRQSGAVISGSVIAKINIDGAIAYCVQPGVLIVQGGGYASQSAVPYIGVEQQELINKYANFANGSTDTGYMAAQALIWHTLGWDVSFSIDVSADLQALVNRVNDFDTLPSINNQTITIKEGATGGELVDTNNVLAAYNVVENTSNAVIEKVNNVLKATIPIGADDGGTITLQREGAIKSSLLFWVKDNSQTIVTAGALIPKTIKVDVKVTRLVPEIKTTATDEETNSNESSPEKKITIIDTISYTDLTPNREYTLKGVLMDKATNSPLLVNGKKVTAEANFIPTTESGTTTIEFTFEALALAGKEVVVFEYLYLKDVEVTTHTDIDDLGQTVKFKEPEIKTTATEKNSGTKDLDADDKVTVIDEVEYKDLIIGKTYTIKGVLMNKATNKPIIVNGKQVVAEKEFEAITADGIIELEFTFDAYALTGQELVVFEHLYRKGDLVISHADINDKNQTVKVRTPEIKTTASDKNSDSKLLEEDSIVTIVDKVSYKGLIVGKTYTIKGVLMSKVTNKPLIVNGNKVEATKTFIPATRDGFVEIEFILNTKDLQGQDVVVFENLYRRNKLVVAHNNINDKDQTVTVEGEMPSTGRSTTDIMISVTATLFLCTVYLFYRRKRV